MLTNVYIMYSNVNESNEVEKIDLIYYHSFHISISLAWINPTKYRVKCTKSIATVLTKTSRKISLPQFP